MIALPGWPVWHCIIFLITLLPLHLKAATTLTETEVLKSSIRHMPEILRAQQAVQQARAARLEAEGAFDARLDQELSAYADGFYDGRQLDNRLIKPLPYMNSLIYGGYRQSDGDFPIYEDELVTNDNGELFFGLQLSLLRNREIDDNRAKLQMAELEIIRSEAEQLAEAFRVQQQASSAYWRWVIAGERINIRQELLELSQLRQRQMQQQSDRGDIARILLSENRQAIIKRQIQLRDAKRDFILAAQYLSLYWRDTNGRPIVPDQDALPQNIDLPELEERVNFKDDLFFLQPEARVIAQKIGQQEVMVELGKNTLLPEVDVGMQVADDYGQGPDRRDEAEMKLMVNVSIPLEQKGPRGRIAKNKAQLRQLQLEQRFRLEKFQTRLESLQESLEATANQLELIEEELLLARQVLQAEAIRFRNGDSDVFTLNLREEQLAETNIRFLSLQQNYLQEQINLAALLADKDRFLIAP